MYREKTIIIGCAKRIIGILCLICVFLYPYNSAVPDANRAPIIIDNTDSGFSRVGSWATYSCGACYGANYFVTNAGSGSKKATWTFQIDVPGEYEISAQWVSKFDRATNAPYTIKNNTTTLATVFVDQTVNGGQFNLLGTYTLQAGTLQVVLTNNANGKVVADAAQIVLTEGPANQAPNGVIDTPTGDVTINVGDTVSITGTGSDPDNNLPLSYLWDFGDPAIADSTMEDPGQVQFNNEGTFTVTFTVTDSLGLPDPTPAQTTVKVVSSVLSPFVIITDNTDTDFSKVGSWTIYACTSSNCFGRNYLVTGAGSGSKRVTWTFQIDVPGVYEISAQWASKFDRATNAPYTIKNNNTTLDTVLVDQTVNGGQFNILGTYMLEAGTLQVVLTDKTNGKVVADAVRISTSQPWPTGWINATPAEMGMDEAKLAEARDYALNKGGGAGFITRGGKLVMAWGYPERLYDLKSTTKSIGVTALGLAIKDGLINLNDKAQIYHPSIGIPPDSNADTGWLDDITILNLATHTSGFDKGGGYTSLLFEPGTMWRYSDGGPNWLAEALTLSYGEDLNTLMFNRVFTPLGISSSDLIWRNNAFRNDTINGIKNREFGSGIKANVNAMARIGYLYLRNGEWNGEEIIPSSFVDAVRRPVPDVEGLPLYAPAVYEPDNQPNHYGLLWWNNADGRMPDVPTDAYMAWGLNESFIVVIPSLDIVVSRAGNGWRTDESKDFYDVLEPFLNPIVESVLP